MSLFLCVILVRTYPRAFQHRARAVKPRNGSAGAKTKLGEKQDGAAEGQFDLPPEEWR